MTHKLRHIRGLLLSVSSQRVEYKPYGYALEFRGLIDKKSSLQVADAVVVEFDIPEEGIIEPGDGYVVVGLEGLKAILEVTADAVDELNQAYMKKVQKGD